MFSKKNVSVILTCTKGEFMILETQRLMLRPWRMEDAETLYELAKDEHVGPPCGWSPHESIEESKDVLRDILINGFTYAICLKETENVIGNIALMPYAESRYAKDKSHAEIGFWLGYPYWGKGYMTEACTRVIQYGFDIQRLEVIWGAHQFDNAASMRVQEKCGLMFEYEDAKNQLKVNSIKREEKRG